MTANTSEVYLYTLEKGSKKHHCPECSEKRLVRYVDIETGNYLPDQYGRCDREGKCSYHLNPYKDGYAKMICKQEQGEQTDWKPKQYQLAKNLIKPNISFIPIDILKQTRTGYEENVFIQNLLTRIAFPFEAHDIEKVISLYHLGTVQRGYRKGAITFPFIDIKGRVRAIQVKQFDKGNHTTGTDFLHSIIEKHHVQNKKGLPDWLEAYNKNETKVSCLFGEHLFSQYPHNPIALVEAPKTAIYGTLYFGLPKQPTDLLWLAVYNKSSLSLEKCKALKGRDVFLFPDLNAFGDWNNKAKKIQSQLPNTCFKVSDLLERLAPERDKKEGYDLADYLIKQDWRLFKKKPLQKQQTSELRTKPIPTPSSCEKGVKSEALKTTLFSQVEAMPQEDKGLGNWEQDITRIEKYYASIELPTKPVKLNGYTTIKDIRTFLKSHLAMVKKNNGNKIYKPYLSRLKKMKSLIMALDNIQNEPKGKRE
ncbi:DUF6371 domain-containing protein [Flammeovirgaceae bacterium SG7u.111]|nr:DUF6371 domain-containing protein [Flammeovirgaceae bacterium SG7u.132]WPO33601.1 DUF6371 domain-containing protein [Flammeovirgaceae bacterium SG7u.111]